MSVNFQDKVCLITASSTGIGYAIAEKLGQQGATVIVSSRNEQNIQKAVNKLETQNIKAVGIVCHTGMKEQRIKLIQQISDLFGKLDILVLNSAVSSQFGNLEDITEEQMDKMYNINIKGSIFLVVECLDLLKKGTNPSILVMSSVGGYQPLKSISFYSLTKTALLTLPKIFEAEFKEYGIRTNGIAPGIIKTNFSKALWNNGNIDGILEANNIDRLGKPEEIAELASFLLSDKSSYIRGETIAIAGKPLARLQVQLSSFIWR